MWISSAERRPMKSADTSGGWTLGVQCAYFTYAANFFESRDEAKAGLARAAARRALSSLARWQRKGSYYSPVENCLPPAYRVLPKEGEGLMKLAWLMDVTEDNLKLLRAAGYDGIEPSVTRQFNPEKVTVQQAKALKRMVNAAGLKISALCALYPGELRLLISDPMMRQRSTRYSNDLIELASDVGISLLAFGSGASRSLPLDVSREDGLKRLRELVHFCGERAQEVGVRIAIEQLNRYETNMLNRLDEVVAFVREVNSPAVGVTADLFHMNIEDTDLGQAIRDAGSLIWHVHLADSNRRPLGQGHLNLAEVIEALHQIGYEGYLSMEAAMTPDPVTALATTKRILEGFGI